MTTTVQGTGIGAQPGGHQIPTTPQTHGTTVLGWLLVCFATMPVAMAISGDGRGYAWAGGTMLVVGLVMVAVGKRLRRPERG
jgi:hypothetical protein